LSISSTRICDRALEAVLLPLLVGELDGGSPLPTVGFVFPRSLAMPSASIAISAIDFSRLQPLAHLVEADLVPAAIASDVVGALPLRSVALFSHSARIFSPAAFSAVAVPLPAAVFSSSTVCSWPRRADVMMEGERGASSRALRPTPTVGSAGMRTDETS
jgi:hypothetical protein